MDSPETLPWYAVCVRARQEKIIAGALHEKGYEVFVPLYRARKRWSDRIKEMDLPLFPGYLFCRMDVQRRLPVMQTVGVLHIVGAGKRFLPIEEVEISAVEAVVASRLRAEPWPFLRVGQMVRVDHGPLTGLEGILLAMKKPCHLVISVTLLQRSVAVEIDHDWVTPITHAPSRPTADAMQGFERFMRE